MLKENEPHFIVLLNLGFNLEIDNNFLVKWCSIEIPFPDI